MSKKSISNRGRADYWKISGEHSTTSLSNPANPGSQWLRQIGGHGPLKNAQGRAIVELEKEKKQASGENQEAEV